MGKGEWILGIAAVAAIGILGYLGIKELGKIKFPSLADIFKLPEITIAPFEFPIVTGKVPAPTIPEAILPTLPTAPKLITEIPPFPINIEEWIARTLGLIRPTPPSELAAPVPVPEYYFVPDSGETVVGKLGTRVRREFGYVWGPSG